MSFNQSIFVRRQNKVLLPVGSLSEENVSVYVATLLKNFESIGYTLSLKAVIELGLCSSEEIVDFYVSIYPILKKLKGGHRAHKPMYPNFPKEVMDAEEAELYLNAIVHYVSEGTLLPLKEKKERFPLLGEYELIVLDSGTQTDYESIFTSLLSANTSLSVQDKEDLSSFAVYFKDSTLESIKKLVPDSIPFKENMASAATFFLTNFSSSYAAEFCSKFCKTATDVLRIAVALSGGDISLADSKTKFKKFKRPERRLLVDLLSLASTSSNFMEDLFRHEERWKRLSYVLHVGELAKGNPSLVRAFDVLRNKEKQDSLTLYSSEVEKALKEKDWGKAKNLLVMRGGDFARRLDHLLRITPEKSQNEVLLAFKGCVNKVATPVLLNLRQHFLSRGDASDLRVFFPKGQLSKAQAVENTLPKLSDDVCLKVVELCEKSLISRFEELPALGKVYVDPELKSFNIPFSARSASKSLRSPVRGSRFALDSLKDAKDTIRFFMYWKNGSGRTDLDLSAALLDENFNLVETVSYYNLVGMGGCHSGDITNAPHGASEFIDVSLSKVAKKGRYLVMVVNSYSGQPFNTLPESFAGWMLRDKPNSGEIFEEKTVRDRFDLTADSKVALPLVIDVKEKKVIWLDMSLKSNPSFANNVRSNAKGISLTIKALVEMSKPNVYDLLLLHAKSRGELVENPEEADVVFSPETISPFQLEPILPYLV